MCIRDSCIHWWQVLVHQNWNSLWLMLSIAALIMLRWHLRQDYIRKQFTLNERRLLRPARALDFFTATFSMAVHWTIILSSAFIREITWAGIHYRVTGRQKVEVLSRDP